LRLWCTSFPPPSWLAKPSRRGTRLGLSLLFHFVPSLPSIEREELAFSIVVAGCPFPPPCPPFLFASLPSPPFFSPHLPSPLLHCFAPLSNRPTDVPVPLLDLLPLRYTLFFHPFPPPPLSNVYTQSRASGTPSTALIPDLIVYPSSRCSQFPYPTLYPNSFTVLGAELSPLALLSVSFPPPPSTLSALNPLFSPISFILPFPPYLPCCLSPLFLLSPYLFPLFSLTPLSHPLRSCYLSFHLTPPPFPLLHHPFPLPAFSHPFLVVFTRLFPIPPASRPSPQYNSLLTLSILSQFPSSHVTRLVFI